MRWHTAERLSPRQAFTPDGFLIVTDTIIARCGDQIYHGREVPLDPDDDGLVTVSRDAAEVFRPEAIASFEGKAITDDHPEVEVTPANFRQLAVGHVQNVRRGTGADDDCLVADLVFTDPATIDKVRGKRKLALSCGYDAHYEHVARGRGAQRMIVGNHVALVDEGRCGARCSIGDSGALIYSYLATHDTGCGCAACQRPPAATQKPLAATRPPLATAAADAGQPPPSRATGRRRGRLLVWIDGKLALARDKKGRKSSLDAFDPSEPRNPTGEWTAGAGGGKAAPADKHHDLISGIGFKRSETDPDTYHGGHIDKATMNELDSFLKLHGYRHNSHTNSWTHTDMTFVGVTENTPEGSTLKIDRPPDSASEQTASNYKPDTPPDPGKGEKPDGRPADPEGGRSGVSGTSASATAAVYRRRTAGNAGGTGGGAGAAPVRAVWESPDKSASAPVFHELGAGSGQSFAQHIAESKASSAFGAAVHVYDPAEYDQMRLFTTPDAKAGFALHGDDIISVYRTPDGPKGATASILALATQQGGRRLDCFDTVLPHLYSKSGFKAVARLPFSDEYKPDGWNYATFGKFNGGRPDVVFMTHAPGAPLYHTGDGAKVEDYDAGTAAQHHALGGKTGDGFDPNQPRIKSGEGGGQWTSSGGGGGSESGGGKSSSAGGAGGGSKPTGSGEPSGGGKSSGGGEPSGGGKVSITFKKGEPVTAGAVNGKSLVSWGGDVPKDNAAWDNLAQTDFNAKPFTEPPLPKLTAGKHRGAGVIIREPDGRVWIVHPTNQYGGYTATFPKGTVEPDMTVQGTALKEAYEESGLGVRLTGFAGDVERDTSIARYYFAERMAGSPADAGWESEAVTLAPVSALKNHLNKKVDHDIVDLIIGKPAKVAPKLYDPSKLGGPDATTATPADPNAPTDISGWKKLGGKLGSNPGGQYADPNGNKFYVKMSKSESHARNELLASKLYEAAGAPVLPTRLVTKDGQLATATPWQDVAPIKHYDDAQRKLAQEHFATHAWLANWDAAGTGFDNQGMVNGKMTTLDPGGSLLYRAQGAPKGDEFGDTVGEWDSLRDPKNSYTHTLFGDMGGKAMRNSALNVAKVSDNTIDDLVQAHGPGSVTAKVALAERLIKRKRDIIGRVMKTADARFRARVRHVYLDLAA